jgi:hypothetical protein
MLADPMVLKSKQQNLSGTVSSCQWVTQFDDEENAFQLQQRISQWSEQNLTKLLTECAEQAFPHAMTWRLDRLELDLGNIDYDQNFETQLAQRLQDSLLTALNTLLLTSEQWQFEQQTDIHSSLGSEQSIVMPPVQSQADTLRKFLLTGQLAWWNNKNQNVSDIFQYQLQQASQQTKLMIRQLGQQENVRRRIIWQWGEPGVKPLISLLEPQHDEFIFGFASQLFNSQKQHQLPMCNSGEFRKHTWLWILTHLLVEAGSVFNTRSFVDATLHKMALHFKMEYGELLNGLLFIAKQQQIKSATSPAFVQALLTIAEQRNRQEAVEVDVSVDIWQLFVDKLTNTVSHVDKATSILKQATLSELVMLLAVEQPTKLLYLAKQKIRQKNVMRNIINQLDTPAFMQLVELAAPLEHKYINQYVDRVCYAFEREKVTETEYVIRQIILTYLLIRSGSQFNRRQFVHKTLLELSKEKAISYLQLLDMLAISSELASGKAYQFELLATIVQLREVEVKKANSTDTTALYCQVLTHYFSTGEHQKVISNCYMPRPESVFSFLLNRQPQQLITLIKTLCAPTTNSLIDVKILAEYLVTLTAANELERVIELLQPGSVRFIVNFVKQLNQWQAKLPCLYRVDLVFDIYHLLFEQLLENNRKTFSIPHFLTAFSAGLTSNYAVKNGQWAKQLSRCVQLENVDVSCQQSIKTWLAEDTSTLPYLAIMPEIPKLVGQKIPDHLAIQVIKFIFNYCRADDKQKKQPHVHGAKSALTIQSLFKSVLKKHMTLLLLQLGRQKDVRELIAQIEVIDSKAWSSAIEQQSIKQKKNSASTAVLQSQWQDAIWHSKFWFGNKTQLNQLVNNLWQKALLEQLISGGNKNAVQQGEFLQLMLQLTSVELQITVEQLTQRLRQQQANLGNTWQKVIQLDSRFSKPKNSVSNVALADFIQDKSGQYLEHPMIIELTCYLLEYARLPLWFGLSEQSARYNHEFSLSTLIADLLKFKPELLAHIMKLLVNKRNAIKRLQRLMSYSSLLRVVKYSTCNIAHQLTELMGIYYALATASVGQISSSQLQAQLWQLTFESWLRGECRLIANRKIISSIVISLSRQYMMRIDDISAEFKRLQNHIPNEYLLPTQLENQLRSPRLEKKNDNHQIEAARSSTGEKMLTTPIAISNAGLVLLQGFLTPYFQRIGLLDDKQFKDEQQQRNAVHFLQFLATGQSETEEQYLVLNKIICGMEINRTLDAGISISDTESETAEGLLLAVMNYWPAIGNSSVDGFRGNWLIREGLLNETEQQWELIVQRCSYDLLLNQAPFSYNLIKYPWMKKPLYVNWET